MRKKIFFVFVVLACCLTAFVACGEKKTTQDILNESVSSRQTACYAGGDENYSVSLTTLTQEQVFVADGKVGDLKTVTTLQIKPLKAMEDVKMSYCLVGENGKIEGNAEKNVLGTAYVARIDDVSPIGKIKEVTVKIGEGEEAKEVTFVLEDKMQDMKTPDEALTIAYNHFKDKIDAQIAGENGFEREIYIRFVNDRKNAQSEYYWYVAFVASRNDDMSVLIDPKTGEIVNSRIRP